MNLRAKLKPTMVFQADTKDGILLMLRNAGVYEFILTSENAIGCYASDVVSDFSTSTYIHPVSFSKFRSKRGGKKAHWVAYVYEINQGTLYDLDLVIEQHPRYFTIRNTEDA